MVSCLMFHMGTPFFHPNIKMTIGGLMPHLMAGLELLVKNEIIKMGYMY